MKWPKEKIIAALRRGAKPVVIRYPDGAIKDLSLNSAARFDGDYEVAESPHEIVVRWKPVPRTTQTP